MEAVEAGNTHGLSQRSIYSAGLRIEHAGAFLRESRPREIALSLLRARRFPRNLGFTYQLDTVFSQALYVYVGLSSVECKYTVNK